MKQIDREMKQNLMGRCPKGKVRIHCDVDVIWMLDIFVLLVGTICFHGQKMEQASICIWKAKRSDVGIRLLLHTCATAALIVSHQLGN